MKKKEAIMKYKWRRTSICPKTASKAPNLLQKQDSQAIDVKLQPSQEEHH
jgi:hypothetical protein